MSFVPTPVITILLLIASNVFMTFAWYGHLRFKAAPLVIVGESPSLNMCCKCQPTGSAMAISAQPNSKPFKR